MMIWIGFLVAVVAALAGTYLMRQYALRREIIDHPNARSSHEVSTPRGGGVAIVATFLTGLVFLRVSGQIPQHLFLALFPSGLMVAAVGFWDDHGHLPARVRLIVHFAVASWALFWLDGVGPLDLGFACLEWGWLGNVVAVVALVWLLNLYNFMDGIDGIAGTEALFVSLAAMLLGGFSSPVLFSLLGLLGASCAGFLVLNWPPAKIFMGDAGSGFLGFALGAMALAAENDDALSVWAWVILLGVFIVDATVTLMRRLVRGERVYEPHRSHAYQWVCRRLGSHLRVTLGVLAINVFWLFPWAYLASRAAQFGAAVALISLATLALLALRLGAGRAEAGAAP